MRISILIPSRNRPRMLSAVITALHEMESGQNEVFYRVGCDKDDKETWDAVPCKEAKGHAFWIPDEVFTIGGIWNHLARQYDADIYSCLIDDAFPISPHWDVEMVNLAAKFPAFTWFEVSAPQNPGYPTCTKGWLDSVGTIVPEHFPFWFSDSWFGEMVNFVRNEPVLASQRMALYSKQEATQNLRELSFWWGFYNATREIRLKQAHAIANPDMRFDNLRLPQAVYRCRERPRRRVAGARIAHIEATRGAKGKPSVKYLLAKAAAANILPTIIFRHGAVWMPKGTLKTWKEEGGYGFITPDNHGEPDVFLHVKALQKSGIMNIPQPGDRYSYDIGEGKNGKPQAVSVAIA